MVNACSVQFYYFEIGRKNSYSKISSTMALRYTTDIRAVQAETLSKIRNHFKFADITLLIGEQEKEYKVNRVFLASQSPVFEAMFYGNMVESKPNSVVKLPDIEPSLFDCIINYCHVQDPKITTNNVLSLAETCDQYQITELSKLCMNYLQSSLKHNSFHYLEQAINLNIGNIQQIVMQSLVKYSWMSLHKQMKSDQFRK